MSLSSIRTKILTLSVLSIILVVVVLCGIYVYDQKGRLGDLQQRLLSDTVQNAATLSYIAVPSLIEEDYARLSNLVSYYSKMSGCLYVAVVNNDNRIMAHSDKIEIGSPYDLPAVSETEKIKEGVARKYLKAGKESIDVSYPIKAGDLVLGSVRMGLNTEWLRAETSKVHRTILIFLGTALAIVFLGIFVSTVIAKRISYPILQMKEAVEDIGRGEYDTKVDIKSNDEIGVLANAFNNMARELRDSRAQLVEKRALQESQALLQAVFETAPT
jgi:methyl-accepting chemotaxis protein